MNSNLKIKPKILIKLGSFFLGGGESIEKSKHLYKILKVGGYYFKDELPRSYY